MSKALKILSRPKGNAEEYGRWSVNPYIGCSHLCSYCFLKKGPSGGYLGQQKPVLKKGVVNEEHAYHLAMAEIIENRDEIIRDGGLFMTFTSDPCAPETRELNFRIAANAIDMGVPVTLLTKNAAFYQFETMERMIRDVPKMNLTEAAQKAMVHEGLLFMTYLGDLRTERVKRIVAFGWTLTGHDELEPSADTNVFRLQTMKRMSQDGFKTWASIEPVIDFPSSLDMIYQALNAGCQHFKIGLLTDRTRVVRKDFQIGEYQFKAYDVCDLLHFIEDVMRMTDGKATVYWKQSVRDLLGTDFEAKIDEYPHSVGKGWSMFTSDVR